MQEYDMIVIGAGNGGLVAALELAKRGEKVLVLESQNVPGGFATSFKRGRFEFEASLNELCDFGSEENPGHVYTLFQKLDIINKISFVNIPEAFHVYSMDKKEDYSMPFGLQEFIDKMEEYVPNSSFAMKKFFLLASEIEEALHYIENKKDMDWDVLQEEYPNFLKVSNHSVDKVLNSLKMPKKAQEILTTYWIYFGSPISTLSFVQFATTLYSYIRLGAQIPLKRSHEISAILAEEIVKNGGEIKYLSTVQTILFDEGKICGVMLNNGKKYFANHIISNASPTFVYGKMIPKEYIPKQALQLTNSRVLGGRGFSIFLALNKSAEDLGLTEYSYFIYHTLNSNKEYQRMSTMKNDNSVVTVLNNAIPFCSQKGTTIMHFTTLFFGDVYSKNLSEENYYAEKNRIAEDLIRAFERTTGIMIRPYIEEIEIASPVTYARYGGHPDGVICGYKATGLDNLLPRLLHQKEENYIPNLRFCGGFSSRLAGYHSTYLSGYQAAKETILDKKGEREE